MAYGENHEVFITWDSTIDPSSATKDVDIRGRLLDDNGNAKVVNNSTNEFRVAEYTGIQQSSSVAFASGAGFLVAWQDRDPATGDNSFDGIAAQRIDAHGLPLGSRFLINDLTAGSQFTPTVRALSSKTFGVTWSSENFDGNGDGVAFRRFVATSGSANLVPIDANDVLANTYTPLAQRATKGALAPDSKGNCVVIWSSDRQEGDHSATYSRDVYADKFYLPNQGPPHSEFRVNTTTAGDQLIPAVAMNSKGAAVVVWQGSGSQGQGVYGQRYAAGGMRLGSEFRADQGFTADGRVASVAIDQSGQFVVVWQTQSAGDETEDVYAQLFRADGVPVGGRVLVNTDQDRQQMDARVAFDAQGNFIVVWNGNNVANQGFNIYYQRFSTGPGGMTPIGGQSLVNTTTGPDNLSPDVAMYPDGSFVVVWDSARSGDPAGYEVFGRRFDNAGSPLGSQFLVNPTSQGDQVWPTVAVSANGGFVVSWTGPDGSALGAFVARYNVAGVRLEEKAVNPHTAGNQVNACVVDAAAHLVVTWSSDVEDGDGSSGIYATRFNADGSVETYLSLNAFGGGARRSRPPCSPAAPKAFPGASTPS